MLFSDSCIMKGVTICHVFDVYIIDLDTNVDKMSCFLHLK